MTGVGGWSRPLPPDLEHVRVLGRGGFGEVVLARQVALDRLVAVKRLHAGIGADDLRRFHREARVLARLDSPTVVRVLEHRSVDGDALLVMEYVPGRSLADLLHEGGLPPDRAAAVLADVATALVAAGRLGVVHRDVKPANVFVTDDGRGKLGDFGLARVGGDAGLFRTTDGAIRGTPAYMAPETALAGREPGPASDAYSWSVMAFEVLTGRLPFEAEDPLVLWAMHDATPPPAPTSIAPWLPAAVDEVLLVGLAKDPSARPDVGELSTRLTTALAGAGPSEATPAHRRASAIVVAAPPPDQSGPAPGAQLPDPVARLLAGAGQQARGRPWGRWVGRIAPLLAAAAAVGLTVPVVRWWQGADADSSVPFAITSADVVVEGPDSAGTCPAADYRATATLRTSAGAGRLTATWQLPDGRTEEVPAVPVGDGQDTVVLHLDFRLDGPTPARSPVVLVVHGPDEVTATGPEVRYPC